MKRNAIVALFVPMLAFPLGGCLTTTSGIASCTGGGEMCSVSNAAAGANARVLFRGPACEEVCSVASDCAGRVQATVKHRPSSGADSVVNASSGDVSVRCVGG